MHFGTRWRGAGPSRVDSAWRSAREPATQPAICAPDSTLVVSLDLSKEMVSLAARDGLRAEADASVLPVRSGSVSVVALVNMFLFPAEVARVLTDEGVVLWVSTNGDATPIYLSPAEVLEALPGAWHGTSAQAGWGTWLTARREVPV